VPGGVLEYRFPIYGNVIWFNTRYEPLKDVRVRRALSLLADRKLTVVAAYGSEKWGNYDHAFFSLHSDYRSMR